MTEPLTRLDRLREIAGYHLDDPRLREELDGICRHSAERLDHPVALVTIVLNDAQLFAGGYGLGDGWAAQAGGTPAEWALCVELVRTGWPYLVPDLAGVPEYRNNPLYTVDGLRSYAGVPLVTPDGHVLGGHCVLDTRPRRYGAGEVFYLRETASRVVEVLAGFRSAPSYSDPEPAIRDEPR